MDMVRQMDMSYSYKPVLLLGVLQYADQKGRVKLEDLVAFFKSFYAERKEKGLVVEKVNKKKGQQIARLKEIFYQIHSSALRICR